jgi:CMP-N-acetylneuraminic acid synthetase
LNGAIYLTHVKRFLTEGTLLPENPLALRMADWESVDIDTSFDLMLARAVARQHHPVEVTA